MKVISEDDPWVQIDRRYLAELYAEIQYWRELAELITMAYFTEYIKERKR